MYIEGSLIENYFYLAVCLLSLAAFVAGYIDSIAGGGGLIMLPTSLMVGLFPQNAIGQSKLISTIGTLVAIRNFAKSKAIIWKVLPVGAFFALVGGLLGSKLILFVDPQVVSYIIIFLLPIGLVLTIYKASIHNNHKLENIEYSWKSISITCTLVGFYDGFFGPGSGSVFIICLYLIAKMPLLNASATTKVLNFASNIGAFVTFALAGKMHILIGLPMVLASMLGNHLGSTQAIKTSGLVIKKVLAFTTGVLFITLAIKLLKIHF